MLPQELPGHRLQPAQNIPPVDPNFNSVTGQTAQPQSQPAIDENANTPAIDEPQGQLDRSDNYGHMAADNTPTDSNPTSDIPQRQFTFESTDTTRRTQPGHKIWLTNILRRKLMLVSTKAKAR